MRGNQAGGAGKDDTPPAQPRTKTKTMPFKDPETRRTYQRELMRKRRAAARGFSPAPATPVADPTDRLSISASFRARRGQPLALKVRPDVG
jgi:hypothetical protein